MILMLAEDEDSKREKIRNFLRDAFPRADLMETKSVRSTIKALRADRLPNLLILDMSLPTFDIAAGEPGGRPQGFGGIEVVRHLERDGTNIPFIVVTQHPAIPKDGKMIELAGMEEMVRRESPRCFRGLIYYSALSGNWQSELLIMMNDTINSEGDEE